MRPYCHGAFAPFTVKQRVERCRRRHEESVPLRATEHEVRRRLGKMELADQRAVRIEAVNAVAGSGPHASLRVEPNAVEDAFRGR